MCEDTSNNSETHDGLQDELLHPLYSSLRQNIKKSVGKGISMAAINVRSILPKIEEIRLLLSLTSLDVLTVCETWLDNSVSDTEISVSGYSIVRKDRNRHGGGVLMFLKEGIKFELVSLSSQDEVEAVFVKICSQSQFVLGCLYRPPSAQSQYFDVLLDCIEEIKVSNSEVILMGDLNFDCSSLNSPGSSPISFMENIFDIKQIVTSKTRVTDTSATLIDVILTSKPERHTITDVLETTFSDHFMVYTVYEIEIKMKQKHKVTTFKDYKHFDCDAFLNDLGQCRVLNAVTDDLQNLWATFKCNFLQISERHAPVKQRRLKNRFNPWVSTEIVRTMYDRDHKHKLARRTGDADHWSAYRQLRNSVTSMIRIAKRNYFENEFVQSSGHDSKRIWKTINRLTQKGKDLSPPQDISACDFNDHFSTIGANTVRALGASDDAGIPWRNPQCLSRFSFTSIESHTVLSALRKLGTDSDVDVHGFDAKLLSLSAQLIAPCLTKMFNMSLQTSQVLPDWKTARITPLFKGKGNKHDKNNYRPIAVIGHIAKLFERQVQKQLVLYLMSNNLINIDQSAYRANHSTQTSIIRVQEDCIDNICDKMLTGLCFLDIRKCFDTIDHNVLQQKMNNYGIVDEELQWFKSYLLDRQQFVYAHGVLSNEAVLNIGVPQGSVLGPTLFMLYVNDISQYVSLSTCNLYADDTVIYCSGTDLSDLERKLQSSVLEVSKWYQANRLCLNSDKSNVLVVNSSNRNCDDNTLTILLDDQTLEQVDAADYLGVKIDEHLSWDAYVNKLCASLGCQISKLSRLRGITSKYVLDKIYTSCIQPIIDYAICSWGFANNSIINKVQRLQNYASRIVTGNFDYVNSRGLDIVRMLNWMNIRQRRNYFTLLLVFKCVSIDRAPDYLSNNFTMCNQVNQHYSLRSSSSKDLIVPYVSSAVIKSSFTYNGAVLWNDLSADMKNVTELMCFKRLLKNYVFNNF